jgi:hypothetical protein
MYPTTLPSNSAAKADVFVLLNLLFNDIPEINNLGFLGNGRLDGRNLRGVLGFDLSDQQIVTTSSIN